MNQTRCQLRHHNLVLQALKDLVRALSHDMYNLHSRTARLEAAAAEFEVPPPLVLYYKRTNSDRWGGEVSELLPVRR